MIRYFFFFLLMLGTAVAETETAVDETPMILPKEHLTVIIDENTFYTLRVEVADSFEERQRGLMFRTDLVADEGMLFVWPKAKPIQMWMKNTPLSLDMVFIRLGKVVAVVSHTTPFSEKTIDPQVPADAVLELLAGQADALGIVEGSLVTLGRPY